MKNRHRSGGCAPHRAPWPLDAAKRRVERILAALPDDVRACASRVAVEFLDEVPPDLLEDGLEPDTLGLFSGPSMRDFDAATSEEAPLVTLFLSPLWDYSDGDREIFLEEVERTFLHELGHYLGLEEEDMPLRDLD